MIDNMDFEIDSDLEALIEECSQPEPRHNSNSSSQVSKSPQPEQARHIGDGSGNSSQANKCAEKMRPPVSTAKRRPITDRPRFKLANPRQTAEKQRLMDDGADDRGELWWQRYAPETVGDLAVHAGKISQVRGWLSMAADAAASGGRNGSGFFRILVVEGAAGTCKSTCIRVLAHELSLDVVEWINPLSTQAPLAGQPEPGDDESSVVRQFGNFLMRAERYAALPTATDGTQRTHGSRIILVDDLPNIGHRETRDAFRQALLRFISLPVQQSCPLVMVVTEAFAAQQALDGGGGIETKRRFRESDRDTHSDISVWSAADVVPGAVFNSAFCQTIKFNPVAPTIVARGLKRILHLRAGLGASAKFSAECLAAVRSISEQCRGDMRSAITMLQMAQMAPMARGEPPGHSRKRRRPGTAATKVIGMAGTQRDGSSAEPRRVALDLFHAAGKVLYAKRMAAGALTDNSGLGRGRLESDPSEILDSVATDLGTFQLFIHENNLDFCSSIDEAAAAADGFSEADALASTARAMGSRGGAQAAADSYAAMLAVHGYMHVRGHPLLLDQGARQNAVQSRGMVAFRKPQFFEAYRAQVANERLCAEPMAAEALLGARGRGFFDELSLRMRIALARRPLPAANGDDVALMRRLAQAAMVDVPADALAPSGPSGSGSGSAGAGAMTEREIAMEKLVLSDDDICEFSD
ncbi:Rad17 cell cycle checkpoint protein-domain-containing protein [Kickxella alabastrina]|uniref:Rad17 cell cycle checkpoint protein-domain-containing protein n=1 Tax=Kickxella alabastrina TaxID=61397 RepID=UPI00221E77F7|nr:Rad17 cell cycle checkpoint protein-domain-containing protein [Kickxella alabastrina]KAI7825957.1 Rad17 cell cycle checkpoint protein-domain-containing protein [Kickxella alabastrina]